MILQTFSGMLFDLLNLVQSELQFNFSLIPFGSGDYGSGSMDKNGEWTGQIGMITRNEVDFSVMQRFSTDGSRPNNGSWHIFNGSWKVF